MNIPPIEPTWHGGPNLSDRESYLVALIDELLSELSQYEPAIRDPKTPGKPPGEYAVGKSLQPSHPIERALRAVAWQVNNRSDQARVTVAILKALEKRGLVIPEA